MGCQVLAALLGCPAPGLVQSLERAVLLLPLQLQGLLTVLACSNSRLHWHPAHWAVDVSCRLGTLHPP